MKFIKYITIIMLLIQYIIPAQLFADDASADISSQFYNFYTIENISEIVHKDREVERDLSIYEKPPLNPVRIGGEIVIGEVMGLLYGFGLFFLAGPVAGRSTDCQADAFCGLEEAFAIAYAGYSFGNAHGVYLVGNSGDETGSFWATIGGCAAGTLLGLGLARETEGITAFTMPVIGATTTFNLSRRYKRNHGSVSLVSFENNRPRLGYPRISIRKGKFDSSIYANLTLFHCRF